MEDNPATAGPAASCRTPGEHQSRSRAAIFIIHYSGGQGPALHSEVFRPIMAGACGRTLPEGIIGDDSGCHITERNRTYGEHTAHYWVLKNYLPRAQEDYIGFCHYRRFLDFTPEEQRLDLPQQIPFDRLYGHLFTELLFARWSTADIEQHLAGHDVILPHPVRLPSCTVREQFDFFHRACDMDHALRVLRRVCPQYLPQADEIMQGHEFYSCNCFVMRRELTAGYLNWVFELLEAMEQEHRWESSDTWAYKRMPAFIMERFFIIWLRHQCARRRLRVLELPSFKMEFAAADMELTMETLDLILRLMSTADQQAAAAACVVFAGLNLDCKLCFSMQELRRHPASPVLMRLLHAEPGQPTLQLLQALSQVKGG